MSPCVVRQVCATATASGSMEKRYAIADPYEGYLLNEVH
jgi:hypothetical protein